MAGAGYKLFADGDVLTAAQVNTYLNEQTVMVFADASARTTALSAVLAEGMVSYLKDTNQIYYYDGSIWIAIKTLTGCSVYLQQSAVSFTNAVVGIISHTSEEYDTNGFHDNVSNPSRITIPSGLGGKYLLNWTFTSASQGLGTYGVWYVYVNGAGVNANGTYLGWLSKKAPGANTWAENTSIVLNLAAGDYVEVAFVSDWATGSKTISSRLTASYLGA